jgi:predicted TIM-barrel fold metal-dependent hydrolase
MYELFSVDDHIIEHPTVWTDRVPARFRDRAPHVVEEDGYEWWEYEDKRLATTGVNAVAGKPPERWNQDPLRFSEMIPGCYKPEQRARDMLANGILASVCFPTLPRFGGVLFNQFDDKELADACVRAYNDFVLDEWCPGGPPGMFVPMVIVQLWDPQRAAQEVRRCLAKGARAVCLPEMMSPLGLPSFYTDHWDPLLAVIQEAGAPICMHIGSSGFLPPTSPEAAATVMFALGTIGIQVAAVDLMISPVCRKFPELAFVFAEGGIGWVPAALERADRQYKRHRAWTGMDDVLPSDIFRRNVHLCMVSEPLALQRLRYDIGVDKIMWECDYPHGDSSWPRAQEEAAQTVAGLPGDEVEAILHGNAERLFGWTMADPQLALEAEPIQPFEWEATVRDDESAWTIGPDGIARCRRLHSVGMEIEPCDAPITRGRCANGHVFARQPEATATGGADR